MNHLKLARSSATLLAALAVFSTAEAQLITAGGTTGVIPNVSVTGPVTKIFTIEASNDDIRWGNTVNSFYPLSWRNKQSSVFYAGGTTPSLPLTAGDTISFGNLAYTNGTTANSNTAITGFNLNLTFTFTTTHGAGVINIPLTISTLTVPDLVAPPTTVAGVPYWDGNTAAPHLIATGIDQNPTDGLSNGSTPYYNNPDYLFITLPELTPSFTFYTEDAYHTYSFDNIGFGGNDTFFVLEGQTGNTGLTGDFLYETGPFTPVPEPSTYGMIGAAALVAFVANRRKRSKKQAA
jgi:hypothetical protein